MALRKWSQGLKPTQTWHFNFEPHAPMEPAKALSFSAGLRWSRRCSCSASFRRSTGLQCPRSASIPEPSSNSPEETERNPNQKEEPTPPPPPGFPRRNTGRAPSSVLPTGTRGSSSQLPFVDFSRKKGGFEPGGLVVPFSLKRQGLQSPSHQSKPQIKGYLILCKIILFNLPNTRLQRGLPGSPLHLCPPVEQKVPVLFQFWDIPKLPSLCFSK